MFESEADRLALIKGAGGEEFSTGLPDKLWGLFDEPNETAAMSVLAVSVEQPQIMCRTSDVKAHDLRREQPITRDADGAVYFVERLRPDGQGMTVVLLRK